MDIESEQVGGVAVVTAHGRLDGIYSSAFANRVGELITAVYVIFAMTLYLLPPRV